MSILSGYDEIKQYFSPVKYHPYINLYDLNSKIVLQKILDKKDLKFPLSFYQKFLGYYFHTNYESSEINVTPYELMRGADPRINNKTLLLDAILLSDENNITFREFILCLLAISTAPSSGHRQSSINIVECGNHVFLYTKIFDLESRPHLVVIDLCDIKEIGFIRNYYVYDSLLTCGFSKIKSLENIEDATRIFNCNYMILPVEDICKHEMRVKEDYKKLFFSLYMLVNRLHEIFLDIEKYEKESNQQPEDNSIWSNFDLVNVRRD